MKLYIFLVSIDNSQQQHVQVKNEILESSSTVDDGEDEDEEDRSTEKTGRLQCFMRY